MPATLRVVQSSKLDRWDVKNVLAARWLRRDDELVPFGEVGVRRIEPNTVAARYGSVHFDGRVSRRPESVTIKGQTFIAHPHDVVFSRIDVRNGAIAVVPDDYGLLAFSNEYPIYNMVERGRVLPDFVRILCRTKIFRSQVGALVVGHSGRKRVSAEMFEAMPIPVPSLDEQNAIVEHHKSGLSEIASLRESAAADLKAHIGAITDRLGLVSPDLQPISRPFLVPSHLSDRWSVYAATAAVRGMTEELTSRYPVALLGSDDLAKISYGISKSPRNRPGRNSRPYLRVANVQDGFLDLTEIKYIDVSDEAFEQYKLISGDVLLCEANGSLANVARPALWEGQIDGCVHQNHVLKVRTNPSELDSGYLVAYMHTAPAKGHFQRRAKTTTGLHTINSTDVHELPIPTPPIGEQKAIAESWREARNTYESKMIRALRIHVRLDARTEAQIAGSLAV